MRGTERLGCNRQQGTAQRARGEHQTVLAERESAHAFEEVRGERYDQVHREHGKGHQAEQSARKREFCHRPGGGAAGS